MAPFSASRTGAKRTAAPPADHFQKRPRVVRDDDYDDRSSDSSGFHGRDGQHDSRNGRDTVRVRDPRDKEDNTRYGRDPRSGHDAEYSRGDSGNGNGTEPEDEDDVESLIMTDRSPLGKLIRAMRATEHTDQEKLILKPWKKAARFIPRCMGPFINLNNVILCGIHFGGLMPEEWDLTDFKSLDVKEIPRHIEYYESLLNLIPQLEEVLQQAQGNREIVGVISHFFEKHLKQARSDDSTKVKNSVLTFIPKNLDNVPNIEQDHEKHQRGFRHLATGRLLTPAAIQWKFNADPQSFCDSTLEGSVQVTADHFPALVYCEEGYFADNPEAGLLKAPLISAVYRAIMTGPKTGKAPLAHFSSTSRSGPGRKSLAKEYGITACVPETIAYATTLTRFGLDAQVEWCENDAEFVYQKFYFNILGMFEDPEWAEDVLEWYNTEVFGPGHRDERGRVSAGPSTMELIAARRRAKTTAHTAAQPRHNSDEPNESEPSASESAVPADAGDQPSGATGDSGSGGNAGNGQGDGQGDGSGSLGDGEGPGSSSSDGDS